MQAIESLNHVRKDLPDGGKIVVLDPGSTLTPEATAMLQALHSRSTEGIDGHLQVLAERGPEKFMSTYYVGYGHKSIGDCGSAVMFIEGVSMLAAKAIQDSKLYNGQESSTRYIDFARQPFINPLSSDAGKKIQENWRTFYLKAVEEMKKTLPDRHPIQEGEKEAVYEKAIAARAFDITRGFLPAGASTNLAWSSTLRQFSDRVMELRNHPLPEVQHIALKLKEALLEAHPNSFSNERFEHTENYKKNASGQYYYHDKHCPDFFLARDSVDTNALKEYIPLFKERPMKTELPKWLGVYGEAAFTFTLDFGSFRDLQRHRAITQRMPLLTAELGFHDWYLDQLTPELKEEALELIEKQKQATLSLTDDDNLRQYYHPMGYNISNYLSGDLPSLVYLVELRAQSLVHPTLVERAAQMAQSLEDTYSDIGLTLHLDPDPGRFNVKRGEQDIVKKD